MPKKQSKKLTTAPAHKNGDDELKQAIQASRETAQIDLAYQGCLKHAMEQSEKDAEDAEALKLAINASLASEQNRVSAIGLGLRATTDLVNSTFWEPEPPQTQQRLLQRFEHRDDSVPVDHIVKVTFGNDVRRLRVAWCPGECTTKILACIESAAEESLSLSIGPGLKYTLKYYDPEGDLCSLVEDTVADFLDIFGNQSSFKVIVDAGSAPLEFVASGYAGEYGDIEDTMRIHPQDDVMAIENGNKSFLMDISIATPPDTPRKLADGQSEEDYEKSWSLIETSE